MDFSWSQEQLAYRQQIIDFAVKELNDGVTERDQAGEFPRVNWQKCADYGILGLAVEEAYSGSEQRDILTGILAMEALGYGCRDNGLAFAVNAQCTLYTIDHQQYKCMSYPTPSVTNTELCIG